MTDKSQQRERFEASIVCAIMAGTGATPEDCVTAKGFVLEALASQPPVAGAVGEHERVARALCMSDGGKPDDWVKFYEDAPGSECWKLYGPQAARLIELLRTPAPSPAVGGEEKRTDLIAAPSDAEREEEIFNSLSDSAKLLIKARDMHGGSDGSHD